MLQSLSWCHTYQIVCILLSESCSSCFRGCLSLSVISLIVFNTVTGVQVLEINDNLSLKCTEPQNVSFA